VADADGDSGVPVAAGIRPAPRKMLVAWSCVCRVTSGTVTVTGCTGVTGTTGDTGVVGVDEAGEAEAELLAREAELPGLEMTDDGPVVGGAGPGPPRRAAAIAIAEAIIPSTLRTVVSPSVTVMRCPRGRRVRPGSVAGSSSCKFCRVSSAPA
jgi:hypothetical protein